MLQSHRLGSVAGMRPRAETAGEAVDDRVGEEAGERRRQWAATMAGTTSGDGVCHAHASPGPAVFTDEAPTAPRSASPVHKGVLLDRSAREEAEDRLLAVGATRAEGAGRRDRAEEADQFRTCFERDRDRILHSNSFRRLAGKTQVFVFPADHQRTRLTHALEVAQVATAIARSCRLNVELTEAIALGHDCGHGPGGHASEDALSPYVPGGFDHAPWGADIALAPLNLCKETLDGVRNHSWSRPAPTTPEGEVVSWADRIAYVCHDFEDAVAAGVVDISALPDLVKRRVGTRRSTQLGAFINAVVDTVARTGRIGMEEEHAEALAQFRAVNYERIYMRPASLAQAESVISVLRALVEHLADRPALLPRADQTCVTAGGPEAMALAVEWVAGMTDRFAFRTAVAELGWDPDRLPRSSWSAY